MKATDWIEVVRRTFETLFHITDSQKELETISFR